MKALSIRQPWAMSIVQGTKRVENRTWDTRFRGVFLIHAGKGLTRDELEGWADMIRAENIEWPGLRNRRWNVNDFDRGGIIGAATLTHVISDRSAIDGDQVPWFFGPYGFRLDAVRAIPFIPCRGMLGFFEVPPEVEAIVRGRLS